MTCSTTIRAGSLFAALALFGACKDDDEKATRIDTAPVERRTITVDAQANGAIEPINVVEVKSKASGIITRMSVETGTQVKAGDLLAQIDTRDVQNQYNQAAADLEAANARLQVAVAQKRRADDMFRQRVITAQEHETAALDHANARAQMVRARASVDLAKQRLEDATVSAPVAGTIIERTVSLGQVITSATGGAAAGTTLLKMADLDRVRVRALFNETDIGTVSPNQSATVIVDAYPDRRFTGLVEKIEPQAVVQQGVTMFPVLVTLDNREALLKPGMNGEVSVLIDERPNVIAIPNDAIRNVREGPVTAPLLGLDADSVQAQIALQMGSMAGGNRGDMSGTGGVPGAPRTATTSHGDVGPGQGARQGGQRRREDGGSAPRGTAPPGDARSGNARRAPQMPGATSGAAPTAGGQLQAPGEFGGRPRQRSRPGLVFVAEGGTYKPRIVRLGAGNFDYTEVVSGLKEGEQVVLLAALSLQAQRTQQQDQIRSRMGGGVPGMQQQGGGARGAGAGGRGGAAGGGGGGAPRGGGPP